MKRYVHRLRSLGLFALLLQPARAQSSAVDGAWEPPFALPLIASHSVLLPTGKVLIFSADHGVPGIQGRLLDPATSALTNVDPPAGWNPYCAGHSFLGDGRLLVAGGTISFSPLAGEKLAYLFDPYGERWVRVEDMARGRWYPTNVTLQDGTVLVMAGLSDVPDVQNPDIELWDPASTNNWRLLGQRVLPYYPLLHLLPTGRVFMAGPAALTETYDPVTNTWTPVAATNAAGSYEGCSVILPPRQDRVMLIGGNSASGGQPTNSAEIIDLGAGSPQWTVLPHMSFPRMEHNAVLLPDGRVLVVGGRSDFDSTPTPVLTPEIFDPAGSTWESVAPHSIPRRYHSTAVLLPDARVLVAGGDFQPTGEIYSPPYLFNGPRPAIVSSPAAVTHGSGFALQFTGTTSTHSAMLIALSAVTHSNNMSQRGVPLGTIPSAGGSVTLTAPSDPRIAPPGFYMLFVLSSNGVPSVSRMLRLVDPASAGSFCSGDGTGTPCPCGNSGYPGQGCGSSSSPGGALLAASGVASLSSDTVLLAGAQMPNSSALYFQGTTRQSAGAGVAFGDGLRCAAGSIVRLATKTNLGGASQYPAAGDPSVSVQGLVTAPGTRTYQVWYRNAASFCTPSTFNLTNGVEVLWGA